MTAYRSRPLPGRARVSLEQLYQADQEMFKWMARVCINGIQPEIDVRPFETALKRVLKGRIQDIGFIRFILEVLPQLTPALQPLHSWIGGLQHSKMGRPGGRAGQLQAAVANFI